MADPDKGPAECYVRQAVDTAAAPPSAPFEAVQATRLCSRDLPGPDKLSALRELYGRELMRLDLWPHDNAHSGRLEFTATVATLGRQAVYAHCEHGPAHMHRSPALMHDGANDVYLCTSKEGIVIRTWGREQLVPAGGMYVMSKARVHEALTVWGGVTDCIQVPHAALARLVPRLEEAPLAFLPPDAPGAALALGYAHLLAQGPTLSPSQHEAALDHLHVLLAGVVSPEWRAALDAQAHPAALAPRLALIRRDIEVRLSSPDLSLAQVARRHHLTPRQVQRLFAQEGTCFSDHVRDARLQRAHAMLADPRHGRRRVLEIAFDCGFSNIATFNRTFRQRYGVAPTQVRP